MIISLRRAVRRLKLVVAFVVLTYCLYHGLTYVREWIKPADKYREPAGRAVKVFRDEAVREADLTMADKLKRFYWYGE